MSHVCASFTSFTKSYLFLSNLASCGRKISSFCFKHYANGILFKTKAANCFWSNTELSTIQPLVSKLFVRIPLHFSLALGIGIYWIFLSYWLLVCHISTYEVKAIDTCTGLVSAIWNWEKLQRKNTCEGTVQNIFLVHFIKNNYQIIFFLFSFFFLISW